MIKPLVAATLMPLPLAPFLAVLGGLLLLRGRRWLGRWLVVLALLVVFLSSWAPVALGYAEAARALGVNPARIVALDTPVDTAREAYAVREALRR